MITKNNQTIKWNKPEWIDNGFGEHKIVRTSKCGRFEIFKWDNKYGYQIKALQPYMRAGQTEMALMPAHSRDSGFPTLKEAKQFCHQINEGK